MRNERSNKNRPNRKFSDRDDRSETRKPSRRKHDDVPDFSRRPKLKKEVTEEKAASDKIRLNRFVANAGVCSRRDADKLIANGEITVNGEVVTQLGTTVSMNDDVRYEGKKLNAEDKVYVLLNKPKDYVTTLSDKHAKRTVMDLVREASPHRIYPVGRLDRMTTGLLLLTNDGDLTKVLTHPKYHAKKIYHVFTDKPVTARHLEQLAQGITLEDGEIHADAVSYADKEDKTQVGIEIHSGRNRIVRRMFEHLGYRVEKLDRVYFAGLTKQNVPRGKWRYLSQKEIIRLKSGMVR